MSLLHVSLVLGPIGAGSRGSELDHLNFDQPHTRPIFVVTSIQGFAVRKDGLLQQREALCLGGHMRQNGDRFLSNAMAFSAIVVLALSDLKSRPCPQTILLVLIQIP